MDAKGFVIPSGGGSVLSMAPGRSAALKLLGRDTDDSIMLFEETASTSIPSELIVFVHSEGIGRCARLWQSGSAAIRI
jgi:hypothetical protein